MNGITAARWIPVGETTPTSGIEVIVRVGYGRGTFATSAYLTEDRGWRSYEDQYLDGVTHWMPLPDPDKWMAP